MSSLTEDGFTDALHECLQHLYDFAFLQQQALVDDLVRDAQGPMRVQAFRSLIIDAIEQLRPADDLALNTSRALSRAVGATVCQTAFLAGGVAASVAQ
ncbi:MAG: hypothetical protein IPK17_11245 [Chloroflexi bacterium]|uniref:hypothetical protein n=1 Tax=Candidatus Flexifilum breve TaxID=3140694 RepID=UPI003134FD64|nr:hypothetical protein [Chloroflexota bacterium]